jgi:hypothetical protein
VSGSDADLHDAWRVDPGHPNVLVDLIVDLTLLGLLDHHLFLTGEQRPERGGLRLLGRVGAEREAEFAIGERSVALGVGDPEPSEQQIFDPPKRQPIADVHHHGEADDLG